MENVILEIQEMIENNIGAPDGLSFEQIAEKLDVPAEWVHCEYEYMLEEAWG